MQTFTEYYFQEKFLSDLKRAFTSNLLKHRKTGVDLGKGRYKIVIPVEQSLFNRYIEKIRTEVVKIFRIQKQTKRKKDKSEISPEKRIRDEFGTIYVKNVLEGEVDSGFDQIEGTPIATIVYELNNGAKIAFVTTEDSMGMVRRYISTNSKGNDFFRTNLGTTLQQIATDSKTSPRLVTKSKLDINPFAEIKKIAKEVESVVDDDYIETDNSSKEVGIMDIDMNEFDALLQHWGTGVTGGINQNSPYAFKGKFTRGRYESLTTGYSGYKYSDKKGHTVYLMDTGDGQNAFIAFDNRESFDWAENIGMLNYPRSKTGTETSVRWQSGTIDNLE